MSSEETGRPSNSPVAPQTPSKFSRGDHQRSSSTPQQTAVIGMMPRRTSVSIFSGAANSLSSPISAPKRSPLSPEITDRVFPIRSVVSVDTTVTPAPRGEMEDEFPGMNLFSGPNSRKGSVRQGSTARNTSPGRQSTSSSSIRSTSRGQSPVPQSQTSTLDTMCGRQLSDTRNARSSVAPTHQELNNLMKDDASAKSSRASGTDGEVSTASRADSVRSIPPEGHLTARFKHVVMNGGHTVITGRDDDTLQRCEDEPIHIPGAIQRFGLLIALREEADKLVVRAVSENSAAIIGYTPEQLFQLSSFLDIFTEEQADNLLDHLDFIRDEPATDPAANGPEVFMLTLRAPGRKKQKLWCAMHINAANKDLIICEFELEDDTENPLVPFGEATPEPPEDTLGSNPTPEEYAESTLNVSKPLRVLRSARKKKGEAAAMEVFNIMAQIQEQLASASSLEQFLKILIGVVKELTGFHRVMIYQFDQSFNGRVVSELVDPRATKDLYKGLNFPASDIPQQARDLYRINKVRLLYDRGQETARLVCRTMEDLEHPLDMTFAYLRAMSPIHLKYLSNMAVRSSMSISISAFDELWGLIACHSYGQKGMRVSFPIRKMCRLVGDTASRNIERLSYASRLQARKLINTAYTSANPSGYIVASSEDLLDLFASDCGALSIHDETKLLGNPDGHLQEVLAMLEFLRLRKIGSVFTSVDVNTDFPDLRYEPRFNFIAGLLFIPLSNSGSDFIVFFRKSSLREVKWAGNPYEKFVKEGTEGYLEPRKSFKTWSEIIVGRCRDWTEQEIETAAVLCLVYGKFIEVWRQKEAALQSTQLQRLLLANSAHEVRTPLNAIINYLEIALEGDLDQETRDNLSKSHSASKSLVYVINDLLDLTKTEKGLDLVKEEVFDFHVMLQEATEPFQRDAQRKSIEYQVNKEDDIPQFLVGDPRRLRQMVSNIIANAIQNTSIGFVKVHVARSSKQSGLEKVELEFAVEDSGAGIPQGKVDALFKELEQVSYGEDDLSTAILEKEGVNESLGRTVLGLGLAVVARAVRNMKGQLRLKTEDGKGSRFVIQLAMGVPDQAPHRVQIEKPDMKDIGSSPDQVDMAMTYSDARALLANRNSQKRVQTLPMSRKNSQESVNSINSKTSAQSIKSGNSVRSTKSDVDRLIDDIQKPHLLSDPEKSDTRRQRGSKAKMISRSNSVGNEPSSKIVAGKSSFAKVPGQEKVKDSRTPIKPVRLPEGGSDNPDDGPVKSSSKVSFEMPEAPDKPNEPLSTDNLSILVAEDDPVNSKIMKKRLEKLGHTVHLTVNGEECSSALGEQPSSYDVVLMDLQMPIVDGFTSTKLIRSFERTHGKISLSPRATANGRIPIFAVSASLMEKNRDEYIQTGFDGWILKPVNFQRVDNLLKGIVEDAARNSCLFEAGQWERGGWFEKRQAPTDFFTAETAPSNEPPTGASPKPPPSLSNADTV